MGADMMRVVWRRLRLAPASLALFLVVGAAAAQEQEIPWDPNATIEYQALDDNLITLFELILRANNPRLQPVLRGVQGTYLGTFSNVTLQSAFERIIRERNLSYRYDPTVGQVIITPRQEDEFIILRHADADAVTSALRRLELAEDVQTIFDPQTRVLRLKGPGGAVADARSIIAQIDTAAGELKEQQAQEELRALEALRTEDVVTEIQERRNVKVEVIELKYANVGATTQTFQGDSVTVPGIDETLRGLVGQVSPQQQAAAPGTPPGVVETVMLDEIGAFRGTITTDVRTNSVIVRGTEREIALVRDLVEKLDKPLKLIEIEVMIVTMSDAAAEELGLRYGFSQRRNADTQIIGGGILTGGLGTDAVPDPLSGSGVAALVSPLDLLTAGAGTVASFLYQGDTTSLSIALNALERRNEAQTIASPRVVTINNVPAKVTSDNTTFLPTDAGVGSAGDFVEVTAGLTLDITPALIPRDDTGKPDEVRLNVKAENTAVRTVDGNPTRIGSEVLTQVVVPSGSTFIIGGLLNDDRLEGVDKVPLLGDIPILGELFKVRSSSANLTETVFFITPRRVQQAELFAGDIATRRYVQSRREDAQDVGRRLRTSSQLLAIRTPALEEDE